MPTHRNSGWQCVAVFHWICERFVTSKPDGLGIGLAISRSIVEVHGGRIWATANADCGLTVHVELPTHEA